MGGAAISVVGALSRTHRHGLVQKDVKPINILVNCVDRQVRTLGFGVASRFPRERQAAQPPEALAGTFVYMVPGTDRR